MSAPGVGVVTATSFVATVDRVERFESAHQLETYLGLVPGEWSSAEKQQRGVITKKGNGRMRWLLVSSQMPGKTAASNFTRFDLNPNTGEPPPRSGPGS